MSKNSKSATLDYYNKLLKKHGFGPESVGWGSKKGKQSLRFEILCQIGNLKNSSILDVGCGFGDLYAYLKFKKINVNYSGIDINENLIKIGKQIYPKAKLSVLDLDQKNLKNKFDWVFFSGISSRGCTYKIIEKMMKLMFNQAKRGIAMNFVGGNLDFKTKDLFYSEPEKIYSIAKTFSDRITIRHDYAPYEFTLYVYKDNKKTAHNVYKNFLSESKENMDDSLWHPKFKK